MNWSRLFEVVAGTVIFSAVLATIIFTMIAIGDAPPPV